MKHILYLSLIISFLSSCSGFKTSQSKKTEDYRTFYQRFHQDSLFQLERVRFPINGYSIEGGRITTWEKNGWAMHKNGLNDIDTTIYSTERINRDGVIQERIYQPDSGVLIERHFSLFQNNWFLTFYLYVFL